MRDGKGRFVRKRDYRLVFDDGHKEDVRAYTPSEAVCSRRGGRYSLLPHTITDMTAIREWREPRVLTRVPRPASDARQMAVASWESGNMDWLDF